MNFENLSISVDGRVAVVQIETAKKGHPFFPGLWEDIGACFEALSGNDDMRAIVLQADGDNFSYGLDLMAMAPVLMPAVGGGAEGQKIIHDVGFEFQNAMKSVANCRQPTIAVIHGWCIGAGIELVAACDLRFCSGATKFSLREVKVGIVPDVGGIQRLPYVIGEGHLREMALTGKNYDGAWAERVGLVNAMCDDFNATLAHAMEIANEIATNPPAVVAGIKEVMNARIAEAIDVGLADALERNTTLLQSADFMEAVTAFIEKREPVFTGK